MMLNKEMRLTKSDILAVCLKLLGIYYFVTAIFYIPGFCFDLAFANSNSNYWFMAGMILGFIFSFAIAYILLEYGERIATGCIPKEEDKELPITISQDTLPMLAKLIIRCIGLWCIMKGIPDFAMIGMDIAYRKYWELIGSVDRFQLERLFSACISVVIGIFFIAGPSKMMRYILKFKKDRASTESESNVQQDNQHDQK